MNANTRDQFLKEFDAVISSGNEVPSIASVTAAIDHDDLRAQTVLFHSILHHDTADKASKLRQRAMLMRHRADEFDKLADHIETAANDTISKSTNLVNVHEDIIGVLSQFAHIEPTKVTNEE